MAKRKNKPKLGKYATAEEAVKAKNEPLIALLKKLDVKVVSRYPHRAEPFRVVPSNARQHRQFQNFLRAA